IDDRPYAGIARTDLVPFARLARADLDGIMPAHVVYPQFDERPAGFSPPWLKRVLRTALGFGGAVVSDDLCMAGAAGAGGYPDRARAALEAGCDMLLVCNDPQGAAEVLAALSGARQAGPQSPLTRLYGHAVPQEHGPHPTVPLEEAARAVAAFAASTNYTAPLPLEAT
ncbi:MAG: glycoside hydrolase family 3 N-terminal domain-containing protein, partial [Gammaproteobacteria bacterium]